MGNGPREQGARQTLREFYEQLDRRWSEAEDVLLSLSVPAAVTVRVKTVEPERRPGPRYHHELGFIKHYGQWGLCYGIRSADDEADCLWTAIRRCSVEQRVEAAACFPELRDKVLQAAEDYATQVVQAVDLLTQSLHDDEPSAESTTAPEDDACTLPLPGSDLDAEASCEPEATPEPPAIRALLCWEGEGGPEDATSEDREVA